MTDQTKSSKPAARKPRAVKLAVVPTMEEQSMTTEAGAFVEKATAEAVAQAQSGYEAVNSKVTQAMEKTMKSITEVNEFAKGNLEAMIASAKAATAGAETLTAAVVEQSKKNFEDAQEAFKALSSAKTPNEALQLQTEFAKAQFEKGVAAWSQWSETVLKVSGDVFQPLSSRVALASETVKKAYAA